ncbi:transmembrane 9 superfamily member, partial [Haematococcus lacustris]
IHWFSIINSCVTVLLLTGFLATILMRVLKADFLKYSRDEAGIDEEESGWKYVHGDVFRFPPAKNLFCAFVGTGTQMEGELWVRNILLTCFIYCGPFFLTFSALNTVAIAYRSTAALPFGTIVIIIIIWGLVTIPLTVFGGIAGKNNRADFKAPCRTNKYPREIPQLPWYRSTVPQMIMAGFLPFSAIYVE